MQTKGYKGLGMEGRAAKWYAKNTRKDLDEFKALAKRMSANLPEGTSVLEVAPGPGYLAIELAKLGKCKITGLDMLLKRRLTSMWTKRILARSIPWSPN